MMLIKLGLVTPDVVGTHPFAEKETETQTGDVGGAVWWQDWAWGELSSSVVNPHDNCVLKMLSSDGHVLHDYTCKQEYGGEGDLEKQPPLWVPQLLAVFSPVVENLLGGKKNKH